jgi:16S rRNA (adenine1518-N6/adenine1519-N6)-dimethyltransferase
MDLKRQFQNLCQLYGIKPVRERGQNFLVKEEVYNRVVDAADLAGDETVLEVGPGLGYLTTKLAGRAGRVVAVELEENMALVVRAGFEARGVENVEVMNRNVLELDPVRDLGLRAGEYKIVANLPYSITSAFLRKFLDPAIAPFSMVLLLQKEVAERITARPGQMSLLAFSVQLYAEPEIIEFVPKEHFWPEPKVDSSLVRIRYRPDPLLADEKALFRLVKIGFSSRRRMLKHNLAAGEHIRPAEAKEILEKAGFSPTVRAQELAVEDWIRLLSYLK